jgi:hypothetical protein
MASSVAVGQAYEGTRRSSVAHAGTERPEASSRLANEDGYYVTPKSRPTRPGARPSGFMVEFSGVDDWVEADASPSAQADGTIPFPLAERRKILLWFRRPVTVGAEPEYLHIAEPRVRIALPK